MLSKDKIRQNVIKYPSRKEASETFHIGAEVKWLRYRTVTAHGAGSTPVGPAKKK